MNPSSVASGLGGDSGALVIDMRHFDDIAIKPHGVAIIGPGKYVCRARASRGLFGTSRLGKIALELDKHGLAIPHGICPLYALHMPLWTLRRGCQSWHRWPRCQRRLGRCKSHVGPLRSLGHPHDLLAGGACRSTACRLVSLAA
jgi:hypothetical protein